MPGEWITGADIIRDYGNLAVEIGQACYDEELHAFTEALFPVLEETKLGHIPKYPPPDVDPYEYIQFVSWPKWTWAELLGNPPEVNQDALGFVRRAKLGLYGNNIREYFIRVAEEVAAIDLMEKSYNYCSDRIHCESRTFCFKIEGFTEWLNNNPFFHQERFACTPDRFKELIDYGRPLATTEEAYLKYMEKIKEFLFKRSEVEAWLNAGRENSSRMPLPSQPPKQPRVPATKVKHEVTQKEASEKLGVSVRQIRNWENGKTPFPEGYTRQTRSAFLIFLNDYRTNQALKEDARARNRATPGGKMDEYSEGADW